MCLDLNITGDKEGRKEGDGKIFKHILNSRFVILSWLLSRMQGGEEVMLPAPCSGHV